MSSNHRHTKQSEVKYSNNYGDVDGYYGHNNYNNRKYYGERRYFGHSSNYGNYRNDYRRENYGNDSSSRDRRSHTNNDDINGDNLRTKHCFSVLQVKSDDGKPTNKQLQLDEITALKSIFDEPVLTIDDKQLKGRFLAEPKIAANPFFIVYYCREIGKISAKQVFTVEHLPPIELYFEFTDSYPSKTVPMFLLSCKWLKIQDLDAICAHLENLWYESKSEILYTWFSFLQNDVLNWLRITRELDITGMINLKPMWRNMTNSANKFSILKKSLKYRDNNFVIEFMPKFKRGQNKFDQRAVCDLLGFELINHIRCYDEERRKQIFDTTYFLCSICFSQHYGKDCVSFTCKHIHCRNCIAGYFETLVKDGAVNSLKCPEIKCEVQAPPNLIRQLISEDLYKRFDQLKLATIVATTDDAMYCPRKLCGSVVMAEPDSSLAHCQACSFAFCKHCKYSYHGIDPCQLFRDDKQRKIILDKYRHANGNEKLRLEKQYGKKQLIAALDEYESEKWIDEMSKRCPHCKASIEKSDGCNKMLCWRCNTYFCWLCLQHLNTNSPYSHYNDPQSKCYNLLFQGIDLTEDFDVMFI